MAGPFYTAFVDPSVAFNPAVHNVWDLDVVSIDLTHSEGSKPTLKVTVKNPQVGLLNPGRKVNLWVSWYNKSLSAIEPLFFGRLVGFPTNILGPKVEITVIADPPDYLAQKQAIAELKKRRPNYDPLFLDPAHRDDPDSILEGYSELWHVDRITHVVTSSDIITGEDGYEIFTQDDIVFDSVTMEIGSAPLTFVEVEMSVQWSQKFTGLIPMGGRNIQSKNGDAIIGDFPQPGASLGGGWSVGDSQVLDLNGTATAQLVQGGFKFQDKSKHHEDGDTITVDVSWSVPQGQNFTTGVLTSYEQQIGFLDPFAVDVNGDPSPTNIPPHFNGSYSWALTWNVQAVTLDLRYDANIGRTERLRMPIKCDIQAITTVTDVPTNTEVITLTGANVDTPLFNFDLWQTVAGQHVSVGDVIQVPVSLSPLVLKPNYQICIVAGTAGTTEPAFSNLLGVTTNDGSVVWAGLGEQSPSAPIDWSPGDSVPAGLVIQPKAQLFVQYSDLVAFYPTPATGTGVSLNKIVKASNGSYQICTVAGTTGLVEPAFSTTRGVVTNDGSVRWTCLGFTINDGTSLWIALNHATTGTLVPAFSGPAGTQVVDGAVTWQSLGSVGTFISIPIGDQSRGNYFDQDRGLWSLEYGLCIGVNHLKQKARCIKFTFDVAAERITGMSLRKNGQLFDFRIPGGQAIGKITSYSFIADAASGKIRLSVQIECTIGNATQVSATAGTADYVDDDYWDDDYVEAIGTIIQLPSGLGDVGYTPPIAALQQGELTFPLTKDTAVLVDQFFGNPDPDLTAAIHADNDPVKPVQSSPLDPGLITPLRVTGNVARKLQEDPFYWEIQLVPVTGQNIEKLYEVETTPLVLPKGVDLAAPAM